MDEDEVLLNSYNIIINRRDAESADFFSIKQNVLPLRSLRLCGEFSTLMSSSFKKVSKKTC